MKALALVFAYFAINLAIWSLKMANILPNLVEPTLDPNAIAGPGGMFSLNTFTLLTGIVGGSMIGIMALVTRSALSTGVLVLWIVGIIFKPISDIVVGLPNLVAVILPVEVSWLSQIVFAFAAFTLFIFVVEIICGREILG